MNQLLKKLITTTILSTIYCASNAGTMGPTCVPGTVSLTCPANQWDARAEILYVQPISSAYKNSARIWSILDTSAGTNSIYYKPDWTVGFRLDGSYHFMTGNDVTVNWTHFSKNSSDTQSSALIESGMINPVPMFQNVTRQSDIRFDAVNGEFAQNVLLGQQTQLRYYGGIQYGYIKYDLTAYGNGNIDGSIASLVGSNQSRFSGVGPRAGADASYELLPGFSLIGSGAAEILFGNINSTHNVNGSLAGEGVSLTIYDSPQAAVPGIEGRLGGKYNVPPANGNLIIEAGWQGALYQQPIQDPATTVVTLDSEEGLFLQSTSWNSNNFAYQGAFANIGWKGDF